MFPLSEQFQLVSIGLLFFSICTVLFIFSSYVRRLKIVPFALFIGIVLWLFSTNYSNSEYDFVVDFLIILIAVGILLFSVFWAYFTSFVLEDIIKKMGLYSKGAVGFMIIIFPIFIVGAFALERQYMPNSKCSKEGVIFSIEGNNFLIPPEFQPNIQIKTDLKEQPPNKTIRYSNQPRYKESLRNICEKISDRSQTIEADLIWITPFEISEELNSICLTKSHKTRSICDGFSHELYKDLAGIRILPGPSPELPKSVRSWFNHKNNPYVLTRGDKDDGLLCTGSKNGTECTLWRLNNEGLYIKARTMYVNGKSKTELINQLEEGIAYTLKALRS